ncbi:hypothetical protein VNO80_28621 [Phaseolus coccineus]|uniref:Uncharacterized protein n=1 Tax=Phaseolus coccineus TaxID=3886 RepID=A0AAN9QHQ8_PHACN
MLLSSLNNPCLHLSSSSASASVIIASYIYNFCRDFSQQKSSSLFKLNVVTRAVSRKFIYRFFPIFLFFFNLFTHHYSLQIANGEIQSCSFWRLVFCGLVGNA